MADAKETKDSKQSKPSTDKVMQTREVEIELNTLLTPIAIIIGSIIIAVSISLSIIFGLKGVSLGNGSVLAAECDTASPLSKGCLISYAQQVNIDTTRFSQCLDAKTFDSKIQSDLDYGNQIGVGGTPSFYFGENQGDKLRGFSLGAGASLSDYQELVQKLESGSIESARDYWKQKQIDGLASYETQLRDYYQQQGQTGETLENTVKAGLEQQRQEIEANMQINDYEYAEGQKLGNSGVKAAILEFTDFECPYCKQFAQGVGAQIKSDLVDAGKLLFVVRNFPLEQIHSSARRAANAAECAADQGKYYEYHDALFAVGE